MGCADRFLCHGVRSYECFCFVRVACGDTSIKRTSSTLDVMTMMSERLNVMAYRGVF